MSHRNNFLNGTDLYRAQMPKASRLCEFHSWHELAYALLLEGDPEITWYDSQPFTIQVIAGRTEYPHTPDFLVKKNGGEAYVVEVTPAKELPLPHDAQNDALRRYCTERGYSLIGVANEDLEPKRTEILNWLRITRRMVSYRTTDTARLEANLAERLRAIGSLSVSQVIQHFDAAPPDNIWLAICRLLHQGNLWADLITEPLTDRSMVSPS